jgi:hypothetical protein
MQPQRLVVPLFQRPYVWNEDEQWQPLWSDLERVAQRRLRNESASHFLGAVVLQQGQGPLGLMPRWTIIDGQQRLTTLQLLLDALHAELIIAGAADQAARIEALVRNSPAFCKQPEDLFKVWPTNRDRPAFNAVMAAPPPIDYNAISLSGERMVQAHRFFAEQIRQWLSEGNDLEGRALALESAARESLQVVVITLDADENAQAIFETLNARGTPLIATDLIKNFVFQRLAGSDHDLQKAYDTVWRQFETGFWETDIGVGRVRQRRSAVFINHWLAARTGEVVLARDVFARFKQFADHDSKQPMTTLVDDLNRAAGTYRAFIEGGEVSGASIDRLGLFAYRSGVLESEVVKPLILWLLDHGQAAVPPAQIAKAIESIESWMVRRMLVRATTKNYNQVLADLAARLRDGDRQTAGDRVESFLAGQGGDSAYWPDDQEVRGELRDLPAYRRLNRGRLRMVLEAIEDHLRGWKREGAALGGERVARGALAIEHVMPRKWQSHWPLPGGHAAEADRERVLHTLGNLTLLTGKLNAKVSNGAWQTKRLGLDGHDSLFLNRDVLKRGATEWTEDIIRERTDFLSRAVCEIWPVPSGHRSPSSRPKKTLKRGAQVTDLMAAGLISPGITLVPRGKRFAGRFATLLADGRIDVDGVAFETPSRAAFSIVGKTMNGWWFFLVDVQAKRSLKDVWKLYTASLADDIEDDDVDAEGDDEE